jgi:multiple sugar transport system permease protein/sn-glycerol 3-phosphate transport system permease protein
MVELPGGKVRQRGPRRRRFDPAMVVVHLVLLALCLLTVFPLFWMVSTALKGPQEIFAPDLRLIPNRPTLENFPEAFRLQPVGRWFLNSVLIATAITACKLLLSVPAAYAFARLRFYGRNVLFALVVGTMIVPDVITIVPNYVTVAGLGWINTPQGVVVPMVAFTGFYVFLLRQAMLSLPQELFDAARIDGAGEVAIFTRIALPLVRPTVAVVTVLSFLGAWNLYLWPLLVLGDREAKTLTVGMQFFAANPQGGVAQWGPLMATATLAMLPPLLLYVVAQKRIVSAFVESGVKG